MKVDGITLLAMARDKKLKSHTILRTHHEQEYFDDFKIYDYYIYFEDNQFHRCDENGKLGAKFQNRFLNYEVLRKEFKIMEEIEKPKEIEPIMCIDTRETRDCIIKFQEKLNELIPLANYLLKKEEDKE